MLKFSRFILVLSSLAVFTVGFMCGYCELMLIAAIEVFIANVLYSLEDVGNRILFLIFNLTFFLFLLGRPVISVFRGDFQNYIGQESFVFAFSSVFVSLLFLLLGAVLVNTFSRPQKDTGFLLKTDDKFICNLKKISLVLFFITEFFKLSVEFEKLVFMSGKKYEEFYVSVSRNLPSFFYTFAELALPALCVFLSTRPSKRQAFFPLCLYVVSGIPMLKIGARGEFVLNGVFAFTYYFLRDHLDPKYEKEKWIGKVEKISIVLGLPILVLFLAFYNYSRSNLKLENFNPFFLIVDFIYKQGVSFDILSIGYNTIPRIYNGVNKFFTFGGFIDYFKYSSISRFFSGIQDLPANNSVEKALYGNLFSHSMSYEARGKDYLNGNGWGSSYILETYADFGLIGIVMFSLFLGALLVLLTKFLKKSWFSSTVSLIIISSIFFIPRTEATGFILFLVTPQFWFVVMCCWVLAKLSIKRYYLGKESGYNISY